MKSGLLKDEFPGTTLYMSPELCNSHKYDYKVDIYSLGLIFFELLFPFGTEMERHRTLEDIKKNKYPPNFVKQYSEPVSTYLRNHSYFF